jgi:hydrogenase maturation protein HypF
MIKKGINTPFSCGAGRLFDAVAALTGICRISGYEGEAPMLLESICQTGY